VISIRERFFKESIFFSALSLTRESVRVRVPDSFQTISNAFPRQREIN
jgi:hypothetical protein